MTGLIYALIIVLWGVVLVPRWLKRHDRGHVHDVEHLEATLTASQEQSEFQEPAGTRRAASWSEYLQSILARGKAVSQSSGVQSRNPAALRRRKILLILGGLTSVSVLGTMIGFLPSALPLLTAGLLFAYVGAMAWQMRRGEIGAGSLAPIVVADPQPDVYAEPRIADGVRVLRPEAGEAWDPRETTLPTYVSKPKATKVPRRIDLAGQDMVAEARRQQAEQYAREFASVEPDVDAEVERYATGLAEEETYYRRAVNE